MSLRGPDFKKSIFKLNVLATLLVFAVLTPSVRIYARWFPEKKDSLWLLPLGVVGISSLLWFFASLSLPALIQRGIIKDLRASARRQEQISFWERIFKTAAPIALFSFNMLLLIFFSAALIHFLKSNRLRDLFINLP
jgi:hypothetical protein